MKRAADRKIELNPAYKSASCERSRRHCSQRNGGVRCQRRIILEYKRTNKVFATIAFFLPFRINVLHSNVHFICTFAYTSKESINRTFVEQLTAMQNQAASFWGKPLYNVLHKRLTKDEFSYFVTTLLIRWVVLFSARPQMRRQEVKHCDRLIVWSIILSSLHQVVLGCVLLSKFRPLNLYIQAHATCISNLEVVLQCFLGKYYCW